MDNNLRSKFEKRFLTEQNRQQKMHQKLLIKGQSKRLQKEQVIELEIKMQRTLRKLLDRVLVRSTQIDGTYKSR